MMTITYKIINDLEGTHTHIITESHVLSSRRHIVLIAETIHGTINSDCNHRQMKVIKKFMRAVHFFWLKSCVCNTTHLELECAFDHFWFKRHMTDKLRQYTRSFVWSTRFRQSCHVHLLLERLQKQSSRPQLLQTLDKLLMKKSSCCWNLNAKWWCLQVSAWAHSSVMR